MASTESLLAGDPPSSIEEIYLDGLHGNDRLDIDALCARHAPHAAELRRIHAAYGRLEALCTSGDGNPARTAAAAEIFERLAPAEEGRYEILSTVGSGGMGVVYRAWDARLQRTLAMKVSLARRGTLASNGGTRSLYRFLDEAQLMGRLDHPGVLPVHDLGLDAEGRVFFTMHLVRGFDLKHAFALVHAGCPGFDAREGWSTHRLLGVLIQVCETVAYAHSKGILHRDLKPSNVMVGGLGETYVMDWGLARVAGDDDPHAESLEVLAHATEPDAPISMRQRRARSAAQHDLVTQEGSVIGTPSYMAPEQARGRAEEVGPRSDVYAVGAMLYHLVSGDPPYADVSSSADAFSVLHAARHRAPTPLSRLHPDAPAELVAICEKAMARKPAERYPDMVALAADLRAHLENRVVQAWRTGPAVEAHKWIRRNPLAAGAVVAAVLSLGLVAAVLAVRNADLTTANARITEERERADQEAYAAHISAAQASIEQYRADHARRELDLCAPGRRGWEWRHLDARVDLCRATIRPSEVPGVLRGVAYAPNGATLVFGFANELLAQPLGTGGVPRRIGRLEYNVWSVAVDPTGRWAVAGTTREQSSEVGIFDLVGREAPRVIALDTGLREVCFHPAGDRFAVACDDGVRIFALDGSALATFPSDGGAVGSIAFTQGGAALITTASDNALRILDVATGRELSALAAIDGQPSSYHRWPARPSPDGTRIAAGTNQGDLILVGADELDVLAVHRAHQGTLWDLAWSPDGARIASVGSDGTLRIRDARSGAALGVACGHLGEITALAWSPTGDAIATTSTDGTVKLWDPLRLAGPAVLDPGPAQTLAVDVDPRGRWIASVGEAPGALLWDLATGERVGRLARDQEVARAVRFDPTGARIVVGAADGRVLVWDAARGVPLAVLADTPASAVTALEVDRERIAVGFENGTLLVFDLDSHAELARIACAALVSALALDPAGRHLAVGLAGGDVRILETAAWRVAATIPGAHQERVDCLRFQPDGARLVSLGRDEYVRLWRPGTRGTWELEAVLEGHTGRLLAAAFTPDGTRLATGGSDRSIRLWDTASLTEVLVLENSGRWVDSLAFAPGGDWLCAGERLTVWDARRVRSATPGSWEVPR